MNAAIAIEPITLQFTAMITAIVRPEPEVGGYFAEVPALPGCITEGDTIEEVKANLREAVEGWLAVMHENNVSDEVAENANKF